VLYAANMPAFGGDVGLEMAAEASRTMAQLAKRIKIPLTPTSPPGLVEALTVDPWTAAGQYALGWTYFCLILVFLITITRMYHYWTDKLRQALYKEEMDRRAWEYQPEVDYDNTMDNMMTGGTTQQFFPRPTINEKEDLPQYQSRWSSIGFINDTLALFRWIFYRPVPEIHWKFVHIIFPSLAVTTLLIVTLAFVTLYCFLPQPLYWQSIQYGSPPLAIRAGMLAIAMTPWIIALSMKANLVSILTGISHERLNVLHRWGGYLCLFLSLVHAVPFYVQPVWQDNGMSVFNAIFPDGSGMIYGTGIACLTPLAWLCVTSLPIIRSRAYEVFLYLHIPASFVYVGLLFWHCKNYLTSWHYLYSTIAIWCLSYFLRIFNLNWAKPWKMAWLIGDEAAITLMSENCIKVTIPTQMRWRPGQFVYLRMPGISILQNHPFTISSLCSEDFPSEYGEQYRDCTLVFRPFGGFTRKVLDMAIEKGPFKTYRAYLDGPYGGMQREMAAFETVIFIAGGSGITAVVSQLLNLIKRMRDGKAVTRKIEVVWALKRLEAMDWFREELRICREYAPPDTVTCQFFVTAAVRQSRIQQEMNRRPRPISNIFNDKIDGFVAGIAEKRHSALIRDEAQGDPERERELRAEDEDAITSLPHQKHLQPTIREPSLSIARNDSLRKLEGRGTDDDHSATHKFLNPASATNPGGLGGRREFHFPPPAPRADAPVFQFAPPSPRKLPEETQHEQRGHSITPPAKGPLRPGMAIPPPPPGPPPSTILPPPPAHTRPSRSMDLRLDTDVGGASSSIPKPATTMGQPAAPTFDFGFESTPTDFQKSLMRFAFPPRLAPKSGWSTEYGRPDLAYMLKEWATGGDSGTGIVGNDGRGILGRRTCVFVCGPPGMRVDVANSVARLQADVWGDGGKDEVFLHTENYAI
jgi:predicted ferric reductase